MAVPPYKAFIRPILTYLLQYDLPITRAQITEALAENFGLSIEDRTEHLRSGTLVLRNRVGWALSWLKILEVAESPAIGQWQLTRKGRALAANGPLSDDVFATLDEIVENTSKANRAEARPAKTEVLGNRKNYRLPSRPLASGGQATVFEATRKSDNKVLILKKGVKQWSGNRMRREIEVQTALTHPNIMPIVDWDVDEFLWYVMPKGRQDMSKLPRPLTTELTCRIARSVAAALHAAHGAGHPHRDIKPANVIEMDEGAQSRWVLADWGLTRPPPGETTSPMTRSGHLLGTEGFAPPEAYVDPHNVGARGDIYALGQLVAWATGVNPIPNMSPTVAEPWTSFVTYLTQQDPNKRPQTILEVQQLFSVICIE